MHDQANRQPRVAAAPRRSTYSMVNLSRLIDAGLVLVIGSVVVVAFAASVAVAGLPEVRGRSPWARR